MYIRDNDWKKILDESFRVKSDVSNCIIILKELKRTVKISKHGDNKDFNDKISSVISILEKD